MNRSHLKWLILLSVITLCVAMFAWRTLGPQHGEASWGTSAASPSAAKVHYADDDAQQARPQP